MAEGKELCNCKCVDIVDRYSSPKYLVMIDIAKHELLDLFLE